MKNYKISYLQLILTVASVACLLVSNIVVGKQILLPFGLEATGAEFLFPISYILSDVFSEVYGYKWSRLTCYMAFVANMFMVTIFTLVILAPYPEYWANQEAFEVVLGNTPRIFVASTLAFLVGDFVNDRVFRALKRKYPNSHDGFGFRALTSSFFGQIADSMIILPLGFYGVLPNEVIIGMFFTIMAIKMICEIILLPLTKTIVKKVSDIEKAVV